jgi:hypothetical protein
MSPGNRSVNYLLTILGSGRCKQDVCCHNTFHVSTFRLGKNLSLFNEKGNDIHTELIRDGNDLRRTRANDTGSAREERLAERLRVWFYMS